ncbi:hypothetical protein FHW69_002527 [Luteibacter sp. Sphag1AF]|uniref:hypothetical protein n=1 Tax=Luteibacter sp. Sphag1AF TaxID=2587031 RepID=UPI001610BA0B|nr:hypothetical protein [Luteibacter sp. Sphag1AF]MBB3227895.1 hypothetical protein [Luteibacter sp. Sphag1AF]
MKRIIRLALAAGCLAATNAMAASDPTDITSALIKSRMQSEGVASAIAMHDRDFVAMMLVDPASPYSELEAAPTLTNDVAWFDAVSNLSVAGSPMSPEVALAFLQWDGGFTKARPGQEISRIAPDDFIAANYSKAGVDRDIFDKAIDLLSHRHSTVAANIAVGAQILRDRARGVDPSDYGKMGVRLDVLERFLATRNSDELLESDREYLSMTIGQEMNRWRVGRATSRGDREIPTHFRVARVAAAYRDMQGYFATWPCDAQGNARLGYAGTQQPGDERPLCFVGATDRAVYKWYVGELWNQAHGMRERLHAEGPSTASKILNLLAPALLLTDVGALLEFMEPLVAEEMYSSGLIEEKEAELASSRAEERTCGRIYL